MVKPFATLVSLFLYAFVEQVYLKGLLFVFMSEIMFNYEYNLRLG
jgi:hypothetical protein